MKRLTKRDLALSLYSAGRSIEEIAAALNITLAAARVKVYRARARLMAVRNPIREELEVSGEKR